MGLLLVSTVIVVLVSALLCIPLLALALLILLWDYKMPLFGGSRSPDDLEKGMAEARVPEPETEPEGSEQGKKDEPAVPRRFGWAEVESLTGNFAAEAVVGEGGSSTVYLARLPSSGTGDDESSLAAVKRHRPSERLHRVFRQELDVISRLRHPNVVRLLGYCDDHEDGVLLFEYSPNGNLHERIHGTGEALTWAQRMAIAHKIALALEYLHESCDPQIVHCDVKASNVLLDECFQPKLCDFGSARAGFSAAVQPSSPSGRSAARQIMGSPGYVDPYYVRSGMTSKKNDVYSFGVLLMELVTGQEAFDPEREPQLLAAAIRPVLKNAGGGDDDQKRQQLEKVVDKRLNGEFEIGEAAVAAEMAAMCVVENPGLRPSMTEVARILGEKMSSSILAVNSKADGKPEL